MCSPETQLWPADAARHRDPNREPKTCGLANPYLLDSSHIGVHGNMGTDRLAKSAASTYEPTVAVILLSGCRVKLRELATKRWKEEWASSNSGAHTGASFSKPRKRSSQHISR
ncbi:hypothetical protein N7491_010430 [Penicillium cf. griseofulvum]|uniref:Uncharacterized protein n=1 Tax=Penicillium cf. griseofulvum TaxID=2972120 RepID=A0A9W9N0M5_9EURO|nr:hypothetical protein N7472_000763 [Penicillium cf. griseofulvum]KAJ5421985.1 hypothetical protein N7491_010430 [Penicillium cf. griseofulvum]KAJ5428178.1 hypothetical protein N7445_009632 [Penicillium cf. griseofulvum]